MIDKTEQEIMAQWKGDISKPVVSICSITYNHEKFIEDALDSFLMQETDFPFEIVVDDDCSTDSTAEIIEKYIAKYPRIMNANLREKNVGAMNNYLHNISRAKGTYIALCEGDDYWVDKLKIQEQRDTLENYLECSFCGHDVNIVDADRNFMRKHSKGRINEFWQRHIVDKRIALSAIWSIPHTSAMFFRKKYFNVTYFHIIDNTLGADYSLFVFLCTKGDLYYINKVMSSYRKHENSLSASWQYGYNDEFMNETIRAHKNINKYFNYEFSKEINIHLNGAYMTKYEEQLKYSVRKTYIFKALINLVQMIRHSENSQYTKRDILWIFRQEVIKKLKVCFNENF